MQLRTTAIAMLVIAVLIGSAMFAKSASAAIPEQAVPIELTLQSGQSSPPSIFPPIWNSSYDWPSGHGYNTWTANKQTPFPQGYQLTQGLNGQSGLWIWPIGSPAAGDKYPPGYAEYFFRAPGTTRIARASVDVSFRPSLYNHHCTDIGLRSDATVRMNFRDCSPPTPNNTTTDTWGPVHSRNVALFDPLASPTAKDAFIRLEKPVCNGTNGLACLKYIPDNDAATGGSYLRAKKIAMTLVDDDLPTLTLSGDLWDRRDGYVNGNGSYPLTITAADEGAGIAAVVATNETTSENIPISEAQCDFAHNTPALGSRLCPSERTTTEQISMQSFPEGLNTIRVTTFDLSGQHATQVFNVIVDRSMPASPIASMQAEFDDDDSSATVGFELSLDEGLPGPLLGSGIVSHRYRWRHSGIGEIEQAPWTSWVEDGSVGFSFPNATRGETVEIQVQSFDAVGNESPIQSMSTPVAAGCFSDEGGRDHWGREIHAGIVNQSVDSITFINPVTQADLLNAIPGSADVLSVLTRTYTPGGGTHSSAMSQMDGPLSGSLQSMNDKLMYEIDAQTQQMEHYIQLLDEGSVRDSYELSVAALQARKSLYVMKGGAPIKSIAIAANDGVKTQIVNAFPDNVDFVDYGPNDSTESCSNDGFVDATSDASGGAVPTAMISATSLLASIVPVAQASQKTTAGDGMEVPSTDVDADNPASRFAPKYVRVYAGKRTNGRFITARWRWNSGNTSYWRDEKRKVHPNRGRDQRGAEIQVKMDMENGGEGDGSWGKPAWGEEDPTTGSGGNVDANLISTINVSCPYPDDYNNPYFFDHELEGRYNLTVGQGCRPGPKRGLSSWTHWLAKGPDENGVDRIGVQVDAMHRGKDDHSKKKSGAELKSELDWCNEHSNAMGSCIFTDHTPTGSQSHSYGGTMLTPGANENGVTTTDVFAR